MIIRDYFDEFLAYLSVEKGDSKATINTYLSDLKRFEKFTNSCKIEELSKKTLDDFILYLSKQNKKESTIIREVNTIKSKSYEINKCFINWFLSSKVIKKITSSIKL